MSDLTKIENIKALSNNELLYQIQEYADDVKDYSEKCKLFEDNYSLYDRYSTCLTESLTVLWALRHEAILRMQGENNGAHHISST